MSVLVLNSTTQTIEAFLSGAVTVTQPPFYAAWADNDGTTFTEGESDGVLNNTNVVTVVAAPAASTRRVVRSIIIYNADTAEITVTLQFNNNGTTRILYKQTVQPGDSLDWPASITASGIDPTLYAKLASPTFTDITSDHITLTDGAEVGKALVSDAGGLGTWGIAGTSYYAGTSGNSGSAGSATTAAYAGTAAYASTSGQSGTSAYSTTSGNSGTAVKATSAGNAGSAGSASTSAAAGTAYYSTTAGQAGTAAFATSAGNAGTASTPSDNDSSTKIATTAYAKSQDAVLAREPDQGVAMTYAASGSGGITVADNDNIDFGTGNFTLVWKGSLPDWTPSEAAYLFYKQQDADNRIHIYVNTDGTLKMYAESANTVIVNSVSIADALGVTDGTEHELAIAYTRETAGAAGSIVVSLDGVLSKTTAVAQAATLTLSNTGALYVSGNAAARTASTTHHAIIYNYALSASAVLNLYRNGIAEADKWGSQTSLNSATLITSGTYPYGTFSGASTTGFHAEGAAAGIKIASTTDAISFVSGEKYRVTFTASSITETAPTLSIGSSVEGAAVSGAGSQIVTDGVNNYEFTPTESITGVVRWANEYTAGNYTISSFGITKIGATLAIEPEGIQPAPGQCLDSSSNKLHAMQPVTGSSTTRYKKDFEYRWTNTWTASSAAQYVGGLNQAVLSADHFITDIITQATVTTDVENLTLGDGSDADRFVTAFAPSATRTKQTIAAQNDGANLKLVYTPAAEATMTIETIIRGFIWEP